MSRGAVGITVGVVAALLAVAIVVFMTRPSFEESMDPALAAKLIDDGEIVAEALDRCAAAAGGSYASCTATALAAQEPRLAPMLQGCGSAPSNICVHPAADGRGYTFVTSMIGSKPEPIIFAQQRSADGTILRSCRSDACPDGAPSDEFVIPAT